MLRGTRGRPCRFCAIVLFALATSPFTAPFATFDLHAGSDFGSERALHDGATQKYKLTPDVSTAGLALVKSVLPPQPGRERRVGASMARRAPGAVLITPLRL